MVNYDDASLNIKLKVVYLVDERDLDIVNFGFVFINRFVAWICGIDYVDKDSDNLNGRFYVA